MNALAHPAPAAMTVAEFHDWPGDGTATKYELVDGQLRAMAPASVTHGTIQASLARLIGNYLTGTGCRVVTEAGIVPKLESAFNERIPDLTITCEPPVPGARSIREPKLIVQILSPSNKRDSWESAFACATLPSLAEIVMVESEERRVGVYRRDAAGVWPDAGIFTEGEATAHLASIDLTLALNDIYADTALPLCQDNAPATDQPR